MSSKHEDPTWFCVVGLTIYAACAGVFFYLCWLGIMALRKYLGYA